MLPSSIVTGAETMIAFLHSCRTLTSRWSMSKISATRRSCSRAIWNGFSRRWDSGASTVVTRSPPQALSWAKTAAKLQDPEADRPAQDRPARRGDRGEPDPVAPALEPVAVGVAAGQPDRDLAGQHVAEAREQTEAPATAEELDVEPQERLDVRPRRLLLQGARTEREDCRGRVRGAERRGGERDGRQQPPRGGSEGDRPRHPERLGGARGHEQRALRRPRCGRRASEPRDEPHDRRASGLEPDAPGERDDLEPAAALAANAHAEPPCRDVVQDETPGHVPAVALSPAERERVGLDGELGGRGGADVDEA